MLIGQWLFPTYVQERFSLKLCYFDKIYGWFNAISRSSHGILQTFLNLTKSFIIMKFRQNCTSEATFVRLTHAVGYLSTSFDRVSNRCFNLNCCEGFWQINQEAIIITSTFNGGLSLANKQYHKLFIRRSKGILQVH